MKSKLMNRIAPLFLVVFYFAAIPVSVAQTPSWVVGTWELAYDPDGDRKDYMEFSDVGLVTSISPEGRRVSGTYAVNANEIKATFVLPNGKTLPTLTFWTSEDRRQLRIVSSKNGKTTVYKKNE